MHGLLDRQEIYARCAVDKMYCRKVVEESLRYRNPSTVFRLVSKELTFRDVVIPKDTMLLFYINVAGRDPQAVQNAEAFDPNREQINRHMAFGLGIHMCLG